MSPCEKLAGICSRATVVKGRSAHSAQVGRRPVAQRTMRSGARCRPTSQNSMRGGSRLWRIFDALSLRYLSACGAPEGARRDLKRVAEPFTDLRFSARHPPFPGASSLTRFARLARRSDEACPSGAALSIPPLDGEGVARPRDGWGNVRRACIGRRRLRPSAPTPARQEAYRTSPQGGGSKEPATARETRCDRAVPVITGLLSQVGATRIRRNSCRRISAS